MPDWLLQLLQAAGVGAGIYAGIRADLARIHERATVALASAEKAHARIDGLMTGAR